MIKDMEIIIVPMVVIRNLDANLLFELINSTMGTMDMDRDMQTTAVSRALTARRPEGAAITRTITSPTKGGRWESRRCKETILQDDIEDCLIFC